MGFSVKNIFLKSSYAIIAAFVFFVIISPADVFGEPLSASNPASLSTEIFNPEAPIEVTGDSVKYDRETKAYLAMGSVVVVQGDIILKADSVSVDVEGGLARAEGNVELTYGDTKDTLRGSLIDIDMGKRTARLIDGRLYFEGRDLTITAKELSKTGEDTYAIKRGRFTTCNCEDGRTPEWSLYAGSAKVKREGYFTAWNSLFYINKVPVLYMPFMAFPVKTERQTGLLTPRFAFSKVRGQVFENSLFWAIDTDKDATLYVDVETRTGLGTGIEYRYERTGSSLGRLNFYHFREDDLDRRRSFRADELNMLRPFSAENDRWRVIFFHEEDLGNGLSVKADIDVVSDDEYFLDFGGDSARRSLESLESSLSITKRWDKSALTIQLRDFDNLMVEDDSDVFRRIPEVSFISTQRRVSSTPIFASLHSTFVGFDRDRGTEGERLDVRPRLTAPFMAGNVVEVTPSAILRWTGYRVDGDIYSSGTRHRDRLLYELGLDMRTTFVRVFEGEASRLRHTIRPSIKYTYIPALNQERLPYYDTLDRVEATNGFRYGINTTLYSRKTSPAFLGDVDGDGEAAEVLYDAAEERRVLYLDISQGFDMREARGHKSVDALSVRPKERPFSDIEGKLIVSPVKGMDISANGAYDVHEDLFKSFDTALKLSTANGKSVDLSYRYIKGELRYQEAEGELRLTNNLRIGASRRYSHSEDLELEKSYHIGYDSNCWGVSLKYSERLEEDIVFLTFSLGSIGDVLGTSTGI